MDGVEAIVQSEFPRIRFVDHTERGSKISNPALHSLILDARRRRRAPRAPQR